MQETHTVTKRFRLFTLIFLVFFIGQLFLSFVAPGRVSAQSSSVDDYVKDRLNLEAFKRCVDGGSKRAPLSPDLALLYESPWVNADAGLSGIIEKRGSPFGFFNAVRGASYLPGPDYMFFPSEMGVSVGYAVDRDDGKRICGTNGHIDTWVKLIGYENFADFRDQEYTERDGNTMESKISQDALRNKIKGKINAAIAKLPFETQHSYVQYYTAFEKCARLPGDSNMNDIMGSRVEIENFVSLDGKQTNGTTYFAVTEQDSISVGHVGRYAGADSGNGRATCEQIAAMLNQLGPDYKIWADAHPEEVNNINSGEDGGAKQEPSCESEGGSMSWIMCSIIDLGDKTIRVLDDALISLLTTPNEYLTDPGLRKAWANLRNLAYLILVPVTLVMLIGTAMGFDFVSAYTVKRALPRLLVATIFIALSFDIAKFLILLTNDVGTGIYGMITSAVTDQPITLASIFAPSQGTGVFAVGGFVLAAGSALALGSIGVILSYLFVALLGLGIGFFLLALRQFIIIALMILAPVAILSWIFPGNDKLWKLWWQSFSKLLMLFPLIMLLIAVGRAFAVLVSNVH